MKTTVSVIKADIGSVGGHIKPSQRVMDNVSGYIEQHQHGMLIDHRVGYTGDDIAILCTHTKGADNEEVHRLAWEAFKAGTDVAKDQGLYGRDGTSRKKRVARCEPPLRIGRRGRLRFLVDRDLFRLLLFRPRNLYLQDAVLIIRFNPISI